jgi:hypothetical protein
MSNEGVNCVRDTIGLFAGVDQDQLVARSFEIRLRTLDNRGVEVVGDVWDDESDRVRTPRLQRLCEGRRPKTQALSGLENGGAGRF